MVARYSYVDAHGTEQRLSTFEEVKRISVEHWSTLRISRVNIAFGDAKAITLRSRISDLVDGFGFSACVNFLIVLSAAQMGFQVQYGVGAIQQGFEVCFTSFFFVEMCLKVYAWRWTYFLKYWNLLDCLVTWSSVGYSCILPLAAFDEAYSGSVRTFRVLRLFRIMRLFRSVRQLRIVLDGLVGSLQALFWVVVMLLLVWYTFSVFFVDVIGLNKEFPGYDNSERNITMSLPLQNFNNHEYFGSLSRSMMTLFGITMLSEWSAMRPIFEFQTWLMTPMCLLIFVSSFGIVNIIIGVIVERTTIAMQSLTDLMENKKRQDKMEKIRLMAVHIWEFDRDNDGLISVEELRGVGECSVASIHFQDLGLPKGFTFDDLFDMLNLSGNEGLTQEEFIDGMHRVVFTTEFHKNCYQLQGMGQARKQRREMQKQILEQQRQYMDGKFAGLLRELQAAIADLKLDAVARQGPQTDFAKEEKLVADGRLGLARQPIEAGRKSREELLQQLRECEADFLATSVATSAEPLLPAPGRHALQPVEAGRTHRDSSPSRVPSHSEPPRMGMCCAAPQMESFERLAEPGLPPLPLAPGAGGGVSASWAGRQEALLKELISEQQCMRRAQEFSVDHAIMHEFWPMRRTSPVVASLLEGGAAPVGGELANDDLGGSSSVVPNV